MTKREKIARYRDAWKRYNDAHRKTVYVDTPWATADEQRDSAYRILFSIRDTLHRLGVEVQ